jgi:hypothetical protein
MARTSRAIIISSRRWYFLITHEVAQKLRNLLQLDRICSVG